jgi:hypothetical protein
MYVTKLGVWENIFTQILVLIFFVFCKFSNAFYLATRKGKKSKAKGDRIFTGTHDI